MNPYEFFSPDEVAKWQLQPETWALLDMARQKAGIPFVITSGKRTPEEEAALHGGVRDSAHISGYGFDLACGDGKSLCLMLAGLLYAGFRRIGIYHDANFNPTHLHGDNDPDLLVKTGPVIWLKLEQN
jgi:hypothetical protein